MEDSRYSGGHHYHNNGHFPPSLMSVPPSEAAKTILKPKINRSYNVGGGYNGGVGLAGKGGQLRIRDNMDDILEAKAGFIF